MCSLPAVPDRGVQLRAVAFDFSEGNARIHRLHSPLARLKEVAWGEDRRLPPVLCRVHDGRADTSPTGMARL
ncbi:unnamed protein product [Lampetra planeri]